MKKFLAIILSVIIACSASITGFSAYTDDKCNCGATPVIFVTGFAATPIVANAGTEDEYSIFMPEVDNLIDALINLIFPLVSFFVTKDYSDFSESLSQVAGELFAGLEYDDNGNPVDPTVVPSEPNVPTENHDYYYHNYFHYDWRKDMFTIAAELNDFIEKTKELTGHDKVALRGESMGGAVIMTYLKEYGHDSIETIVMQSSAFCGITLMEEMFKGNLEVDADCVLNYICNFLEGNDELTVFYRLMLTTLGKAVLVPVCNILDKFIENIRDDIYEDGIRDLFGNFPGLWAFIPTESFEECKAYMLDETENAELIKKIDRYNYEVASNRKQLLDDAMKDGVKLAIVSHYDKGACPAIENASYQSDFLIDTSRTSFGATCAPIKSTLPEDYTQAVDCGHNHISCDRVIDASTCTYPEYTWFIKDNMHTSYYDSYNTFIFDLMYSDAQPTVHTLEGYPQFLLTNHETRGLEPLTEENCKTQRTELDISEFIKVIADKIAA